MSAVRRIRARLALLAAGLAVAAGIAATRDRWWIVPTVALAVSAGGYLVATVKGESRSGDTPD